MAPIAAVAQADAAAAGELAALLGDGGMISLPATLPEIIPLIQPPLRLQFTRTIVQMVWTPEDETRRATFPTPVPLSSADAREMLNLALLTRPGPFQPETYRFGGFVGIHIDGRLAAMGGLRMHVKGYRELSGICSHPDFRGRGLARAIVNRLIDDVVRDGLTPFLHVEETNLSAQALYTKLGFVERTRVPVIGVERTSSG